jgi:hypothetical protein
MRRILEISPAMDERITELINSKGYRDFQHFVSIALENQIIWEKGKLDNQNSWNGSQSSIYHEQTRDEDHYNRKDDFAVLKIRDDLEIHRQLLQSPQVIRKVLWGQYYRFLPVKVGVRVLYNMYTDRFPNFRDFTAKVRDFAIPLRHRLVKMDKSDNRKFGDLLSASFPAYDEKSVRRFLNQYMLYIRTTDMTPLGMMPDLKFVNIIQENDIIRIGLTNFGNQFATLQNPVLDLNEPESLSIDEIHFLLNHIAGELPDEFELMMIALKAIAEGRHTRAELNSILEKCYLRFHEGITWSETVVNTMRAGLLSRLNEINLVRREKRGKNILYYITDNGNKFIEGGPNFGDRFQFETMKNTGGA